MGSPYNTSGGSSGSKYNTKTTARKSSSKKKDGGGHSVGGFLDNVGSGIKNLAVGSAVSGADLVQAAATDAYEGKGIVGLAATPFVAIPRVAVQHDIWKGGRSNVDKFAEPYLKGQAQGVKNLAKPEQWYNDPVGQLATTSMILGGVAGGVGRGTNAGRALKAGSKADAVKALVAPKPETRYVKVTNPETGVTKTVVKGTYSKSTLARQAQKQVDKRRGTTLAGKNADAFGKAADKQVRRALDIENIPAAQLERMTAKDLFGRRYSDAQFLAVRSVLEKTHPKLYIADLQKQLENPKITRLQRAQTKDTIRSWEQAKRYVDPDPIDATIPVLADAKLQKIVDKSLAVVAKQDANLLDSGKLDPVRAAHRNTAPGRLLRGAEFDPVTGALVGAEDFAGSGAVRVPWQWSTRDRISGNVKGAGQGGVVGNSKSLGRLSHSFTGGIMRAGGGSRQVPKMIAQSAKEANRYLNGEEFRGLIRDVAVRDPELLRPLLRKGERPVAVRDPGFRDPLNSATKDFIAQHIEDVYFSRAEKKAMQETMTLDELAESFPSNVPLGPQEGIKWIPQSALNNLNRAPVGASLPRGVQKALSAFDAINNAQKLAILYLKPAYIIPNMVGNAFLVTVQQGVLAPGNLARASRTAQRIFKKPWDEQFWAAVDLMVGERGVMSVLEAQGAAQFTGRAVGLASHAYGKFVDIPFRRASFLHEAHRRGYRTPEQLRKLVEDPALRDDLHAVSIEANKALIDFGQLGPVEQAITRRLIFFYPWIKGASVYGGQFVRDHPIQTGVYSSAGETELQKQFAELGPVPSYASALLKVGGTDALPETINTQSAGVLQTPYDLAHALAATAGLAQGGGVAGNLTPMASFFNTLVNGENKFGFTPKGQSKLHTALSDQYDGLPLWTLKKRIDNAGNDQSQKLYQYDSTDALLQWLLGGAIAPKTTNRAKLNSEANAGR